MIDVINRTRFDPGRLHGHIKMELIDAKTKKVVQTVERDNLVTNALQYIMNDVAGGMPSNLSSLIMPVAEHALGGLMLFENAIDEDEANIHFPFGPNGDGDYPYLVAGAGRNSNTNNSRAGSLNAAESGPTDRGYVSVWDFGTSQANGTIRAAALTLASGSNYLTTPFATGNSSYYARYIRRSDGQTNWSAQPLYYDPESKMLYFTSTDSSMGFSITSSYSQGVTTYTYTMAIYSVYMPLHEFKVADAVNDARLPIYVKSITWDDTVYYDPLFLPAYDGYAYFANAVGNADGNGTFKYLALHTDDKSFDLSSLTTVTLMEAYLRQGQTVRATEKYFWCTSYDKHSLYRVDRSNLAAVDLFQLPEDHYSEDPGRACRGGGLNLMIYCPAANGQTNYYDQYDAMIYEDGTIIKNGTYFLRSNGVYSGGSSSCPQAAYESPYLWIWGAKSGYSAGMYGSYGLPSARYLGTIANLSSAVVKNASQTLKVTYTLTDE